VNKALLASLVTFSVLIVLPGSADAEVNDHLKCRRIEAGDKIKIKVMVDALDDRFDVRRCKVHRARLFCSAHARTGIDPTQEFEFVKGDELGSDYVCYNTKCRSRPDTDLVTDAFGTRRIGKLKSKLLCVPTEPEPAA
jgi:hypothetical protein